MVTRYPSDEAIRRRRLERATRKGRYLWQQILFVLHHRAVRLDRSERRFLSRNAALLGGSDHLASAYFELAHAETERKDDDRW